MDTFRMSDEQWARYRALMRGVPLVFAGAASLSLLFGSWLMAAVYGVLFVFSWLLSPVPYVTDADEDAPAGKVNGPSAEIRVDGSTVNIVLGCRTAEEARSVADLMDQQAREGELRLVLRVGKRAKG